MKEKEEEEVINGMKEVREKGNFIYKLRISLSCCNRGKIYIYYTQSDDISHFQFSFSSFSYGKNLLF